MNMNQPSNEFRILAVSLSSRGFGYAVMEGGNKLILYGKKIFNYDKNARSLAQIEKVIAHNQPDVLVLQDVNAKSMLKIPAKTCHSTSVGSDWSCSHARTFRSETPDFAAISSWERLASMRFNNR
jgi:hypothetical protein